MRFFLLIPLVVALAGPGAGAARAQAAPPAKAVLETVPDVRQSTDYTCGVASLVAVLAYYGIEATEEALTRELAVDPEVGAELEHLAAAALKRGLEAAVREKLSLRDLERELAARRPVIVLNQSWRTDPKLAWRDAWDDGHYLVVIGIDADKVYVEDPSLEDARGTIPRAEFVERWHGWTIDEKKTEGQALLVKSPRGPSARAPRRTLPFEPVE